MFSAYCKHCGTVVLLGPADVRFIHNTSSGIVVYFRCHAGHPGVWLPGRRSPGRTLSTSGQVAAGRGARAVEVRHGRSWRRYLARSPRSGPRLAR